MRRRALQSGIATLLITGGSASATPCPAAVDLTGDPEAVAAVTSVLESRGIALADPDRPECGGTRVTVTKRGPNLVVTQPALAEERVVSDAVTAATVIESWSAAFVGPSSAPPALASRPLATTALAPAPLIAGPSDELVAVPTAKPHGVHVFIAMETSFAVDRSSWLGAVGGVAIPIGRVWLAARARVAAVVDGPAPWRLDRTAEDALFGAEVPFVRGSTVLWLGASAGMGAVHTSIDGPDRMSVGSETFGLRADAHVTWTIHVVPHLALDLSAALDAAQVTDIEGSLSAGMPDEPALFGRVGVGARVGGL